MCNFKRIHLCFQVQMEFVYDVLVENILTGDYDIDVNHIPMEFSRIKEPDISTRISILEHQFQVSQKCNYDWRSNRCILKPMEK